jgi:type III restriction enzyme
MSHLHQVLARKVQQWRKDGYPSPDYPAISEIFEWARDPDTGTLRFLRTPQLRALETYWYLRLVEGTPHIFSLYRKLFSNPPDLMDALGLNAPEVLRSVAGQPLDTLWEQVRSDDEFVRRFRLESLRETLTLDYPS